MQDSESSVVVSHIFCRLVQAEKQSNACTASAATRHNSVTSEASEYERAVCNMIFNTWRLTLLDTRKSHLKDLVGIIKATFNPSDYSKVSSVASYVLYKMDTEP